MLIKHLIIPFSPNSPVKNLLRKITPHPGIESGTSRLFGERTNYYFCPVWWLCFKTENCFGTQFDKWRCSKKHTRNISM